MQLKCKNRACTIVFQNKKMLCMAKLKGKIIMKHSSQASIDTERTIPT
uniref:Uncharacterized protein n=1 Tax=Anguilla anguilla TaxID=7936 RepID=A0A0E9RKK4_ANGAN